MQVRGINSFAANFLTYFFLSATFIATVKGIMPYEVSTFSKILILGFLLSIHVIFYKYSKSDLSKQKTS